MTSIPAEGRRQETSSKSEKGGSVYRRRGLSNDYGTGVNRAIRVVLKKEKTRADGGDVRHQKGKVQRSLKGTNRKSEINFWFLEGK